ncbi:MAG: hypothetical protein K2G72_02835, partial [Duncaniella sp.]|nr:hypothetical protein [Duncaniella sp.]
FKEEAALDVHGDISMIVVACAYTLVCMMVDRDCLCACPRVAYITTWAADIFVFHVRVNAKYFG